MLKTNLPRNTSGRLNLALDLLIDYMLECYQEDDDIRRSNRIQGLRSKAISSEKQQQSNIRVIS